MNTTAGQLYRIDRALAGVDTATTRDFYKAVEVFGWPSAAASGCLLAVVREAHSDDSIHAIAGTHEGELVWDVWDCNRDIAPMCPTEVAALVAALEAAP